MRRLKQCLARRLQGCRPMVLRIAALRSVNGCSEAPEAQAGSPAAPRCTTTLAWHGSRCEVAAPNSCEQGTTFDVQVATPLPFALWLAHTHKSEAPAAKSEPGALQFTAPLPPLPLLTPSPLPTWPLPPSPALPPPLPPAWAAAGTSSPPSP